MRGRCSTPAAPLSEATTGPTVGRLCSVLPLRYEVLADPEEAAWLIDDPMLSGYLTKGGLTRKGELYDAVASLVRVLDGKDVDSAALRSALTRGFKKRRWAWPKSFEGLKGHILGHPPEGV